MRLRFMHYFSICLHAFLIVLWLYYRIENYFQQGDIKYVVKTICVTLTLMVLPAAIISTSIEKYSHLFQLETKASQVLGGFIFIVILVSVCL